MNRRNFLKYSALGGATAASLPYLGSRSLAATPTDEVGPDPAQQAWMDLGFGMFIHFGINTYYDVEWSDGTLDPIKVNPTRLDTDQWCATAKAAGMKYIVLVTKHHDGFCLWPSRYTTYSVASTPFKKDIVAELANSAAKHGLKLGLYYSLWDRHEKSHDTDEYRYVLDFMKGQLEELLTGYGPVVELWFDGFWKKQQSGWTKKLAAGELEGEAGFQEQNQARDEAFVQAWRQEGAYRWQMDHIYQYIKSLQPDCLVMNNSTTAYPGVPLHPVDIRSGEKYTQPNPDDQKIWTWLGKPRYLPLQIETTMSVRGNDRFKSGNWFWHASDTSVASPDQIRQYLAVARQMHANLLLNCGPDPEGRLRAIDEATLRNLPSH